MPTPREAIAQVAATLADINPADREAVSGFYQEQFPRYPKDVQEVISGFLIGLTDTPTPSELSKLRHIVRVAKKAATQADIAAAIKETEHSPAPVTRHGVKLKQRTLYFDTNVITALVRRGLPNNRIAQRLSQTWKVEVTPALITKIRRVRLKTLGAPPSTTKAVAKRKTQESG